MRLVSLAVILLAAAVWLAVNGRTQSGEERSESKGITPSDRRAVVVFDGPRSAREYLANLSDPDFARRSDFDRVRAAVREFSEEELLEMVATKVPANDQATLWRISAIWERLGELRSERAVDLLVDGRALSPNPGRVILMRPDQSAHALVGGWASSLDSLEEIQEELFPHLLKLKQAGFKKHELALGREMARFDPMAAWNVLSATQDTNSPLTGFDDALRGLVKGLAGRPGLAQLMPFIQMRSKEPTVIDWDRFGSVTTVAPSTITMDQPLDSGSLIIPTTTVVLDPQVSEVSTVVLLGSQEPDFYSQALGSLMISSPQAAKNYLDQSWSHRFEGQQPYPNVVWKTMAELDPGAALNLLHDPDYSVFAPDIAKGLVASEPERVEEILGFMEDPNDQIRIIAEAVNGTVNWSPLATYPADPGNSKRVDQEERRRVIEQAIENSELNEEQREEFKKRLHEPTRNPPTGFIAPEMFIPDLPSLPELRIEGLEE